METQRYAPPGAQVGDIVDGTDERQMVRLWPASGRMGRVRFFVWNVAFYAIFFVVLLAFTLLGGIGGESALSLLLLGILYVAYLFVVIVLLVQRSHDMDLVGWWSLLAFIPLVGFYWLLKGGTPGRNRFGPPTVPNSTAVVVVAWIAGGLALLFFVVAIVGGGIAGFREAQQQGTVQSR